MSAEMMEQGRSEEAEANLAAWKAVLTELEDNLEAFRGPGDVSEQARMLAQAWTPPSDLGPLPAELASRAHLLAKAQERAYVQLRAQVRMTRRQAELIRSVPGQSSGAVYLDVAG